MMRESLLSQNTTVRGTLISRNTEDPDAQDVKYLLSSRESIFHSSSIMDTDIITGVLGSIKHSFEINETVSSLSFKYIFHTAWTTYVLCMSLLGGVVMLFLDGGKAVGVYVVTSQEEVGVCLCPCSSCQYMSCLCMFMFACLCMSICVHEIQ